MFLSSKPPPAQRQNQVSSGTNKISIVDQQKDFLFSRTEKELPFHKQVHSGNDLSFNKQIHSGNDLQGTNLLEEHYKWTFLDPPDAEDLTVCLRINLTPIPNQKKRFLTIQNFSTFLLNYGGSDFPSGISLCCMQLAGFFNETKCSTNIISTSTPNQITSVLNTGGIIGYNVLYTNKNINIWEITNINVLEFKLKLYGDTAYRTLPAAQPLQIEAKISRVIF